MSGKRCSPEKIVRKGRAADMLLAPGLPDRRAGPPDRRRRAGLPRSMIPTVDG
jgi:hypothetical protein